MAEFVVAKVLPELQEPAYWRVTPKTSVVLVQDQPQSKQEMKAVDAATPLYGMEKPLSELLTCIRKSLLPNLLLPLGLTRIKGILLLSISGMGKTALVNHAKTVLSEFSFRIHQSFSLLSRVVGGSEQLIKKIFKEALQSQPCVLVFEDLHLLFGKGKN